MQCLYFLLKVLNCWYMVQKVYLGWLNTLSFYLFIICK